MNYPLDFGELVNSYTNTASSNEAILACLTAAGNACPLLSTHRSYVRRNHLGYGEPAFDAMWASLLVAASKKFGKVRALEIGVYKGQMLALWSKIAEELNIEIEVHAITPLAGNPRPWGGRFIKRVRRKLSRSYREQDDVGNFQPDEDYEACIRVLFSHHKLDFSKLHLHRGYSTDPKLIDCLRDSEYEIIFVDGDHSEAGARHDFRTYGPKVVPGGWLVADDAGFELPGNDHLPKGYKAVSDALGELKSFGFENVLNVWHQRVFQR